MSNFIIAPQGSDTSTAAKARIEAGTLLRPEGVRHYLKAVPGRAAAGSGRW